MSTERCADDLRVMVEAVEIQSPTCYRLLGEPHDHAGLTPHSPDEPVILPFLERQIYARLYTQPSGVPSTSDPLAQRDHINTLSAANTGQGTWEPGWQIIAIDSDGRLQVSRDQLNFWALPSGVQTATGSAQPGQLCRVWVAKEMRHLMPGFYMAFGNGSAPDRGVRAAPLVRCYWNLPADTAVAYMALVTQQLNQANIPFRTKVLSDPAAYVRADGGVLYLERHAFSRARPLIATIHAQLAARLRPAVPLCTKMLAPGLGLAEDPGDGLSFGQSRCQLVAQALWSCFASGEHRLDQRLAAVAQAFRQAGLHAERPFLARRSVDTYSLGQGAPPRVDGSQAAVPRGRVRRPASVNARTK